ncbi:MAG: hypothetical protein KKB39_00350 [Nanoarchaeota archaeon]|nr:hypothetical protein [Nanoarchaeota archaeon]
MDKDTKISQFRDGVSLQTSKGISKLTSPEDISGIVVKRDDWLTVYVFKEGLTPQQELEALKLVEQKYAVHEKKGEPSNVELNSLEAVRKINSSLLDYVLESYATTGIK